MPFVETPAVQGFRRPLITKASEAAMEAEAEATEPDFLNEVVPAAFRTDNTVVSALDALATGGIDRGVSNPDYDPFTDIEGYEEQADAFVYADTPDEVARVKRRIDREKADRETVARSGLAGMAASMAAGVIDPINLIPVGGAGYRTYKAGGSILKGGLATASAGFAASTAAEMALHSTQHLRTVEESAANVAASVFLSGLLGTAAAGLSRARVKELSAAVEHDMTLPPDSAPDPLSPAPESTVGAAQVYDPEGSKLSSAMGAEKLFRFQDPLMRTQTSQSAVTRRIVEGLAEGPLLREKNLRGAPTEIAVETRAKVWQGALYDAMRDENDIYSQYRLGRGRKIGDETRFDVADTLGQTPAGKLSLKEFREEVGRAMRRGDKHDIPEVAEAARAYREKLYDPLAVRAQETGALPEDLDVKTATGYVNRLYDREKIKARRPEFKRVIADWLIRRRNDEAAAGESLRGAAPEALLDDLAGRLKTKDLGGLRQPAIERAVKKLKRTSAKPDENAEAALAELTPAAMDNLEAESLADEIIGRILSTPDGRLPYDVAPDKISRLLERDAPRGPLASRVFLIEDELIEDFLIDDIGELSRAFARTVPIDVEMAAHFGSTDMTVQMKKIMEDWDRIVAGAKTGRQRKKLEDKREADIRDVAAMRDRLKGIYGVPEDPDGWAARTGRVLRNLNFTRLLGGVHLSSIPDLAHMAMTQGMKPIVGDGLAPLIKNAKAWKMAAEEVKLAGTALDMVISQRTMALADVGDGLGRGTRAERAIEYTADKAGHVFLLNPWNAALKQVTGVTVATKILRAAKTGEMTTKQRRDLAGLGLGREQLRRIGEQFKKHGDEQDGALLARTDLWDDKEAAVMLRAAIVKETDRVIVTPGQDKPLWMSQPYLRMISQFKTFAFAATQRIALSALQRRDMAALNGAVLMVGLGMMSYWTKMTTAGYAVSDDPTVWLAEGVDRSGLMFWLFDANNILEKASRGRLGVSALLGAPPMSRYASRNLTGALLGPTTGLVEDFGTVTGSLSAGDWRESDTRAVRRLLPFQNLYYIRLLLNQAEEGINSALGVPQGAR